MSIEFCINQYDEERCYSNGTIDLKSFLTALYSDENIRKYSSREYRLTGILLMSISPSVG